MGRPDFFTGGVSPQKAEELKRSFKQLVEEGAEAVPAIRAKHLSHHSARRLNS